MLVQQPARLKAKSLLPLLAALAVVALIGMALGGWLEMGPQMMLTLGAQTLAWCF